MNNLVLSISDLHISFHSESITSKALHGINVLVHAGKCVGVVGESGSGKSITFLAAIGLLNPKGKITQGEITFHNKEEIQKFGPKMRHCPWLGDGVSIIFQEPLTALNPTMRCGSQVLEAIKTKADRNNVIELFETGYNWICRIKYINPIPMKLVEGQRQRVMIAMALAAKPLLIIADEPTTALDPKVQDEVLSLLKNLCLERNVALVLISHDLDAVEAYADDVYVFYQGKVMEQGTASEVVCES